MNRWNSVVQYTCTCVLVWPARCKHVVQSSARAPGRSNVSAFFFVTYRFHRDRHRDLFKLCKCSIENRSTYYEFRIFAGILDSRDLHVSIVVWLARILFSFNCFVYAAMRALLGGRIVDTQPGGHGCHLTACLTLENLGTNVEIRYWEVPARGYETISILTL